MGQRALREGPLHETTQEHKVVKALMNYPGVIKQGLDCGRSPTIHHTPLRLHVIMNREIKLSMDTMNSELHVIIKALVWFELEI